MVQRLFVIASLILASGLKHVAPKPRDQFDRIAWSPDYAAARAKAVAEHKPLLVVMVAGQRDGEC